MLPEFPFPWFTLELALVISAGPSQHWMFCDSLVFGVTLAELSWEFSASSVAEALDVRSSRSAPSGTESTSRGSAVHVGVLCSRNTLQQIWDLLCLHFMARQSCGG